MPSRKFRSEGPILYDRYRFGYCEWLELEAAGDSGWEAGLAQAYAEGYLPYSAEPADPRHLFYMARSLRVDLGRLAMDKGRRYDHRQWAGAGLQRQQLDKAAFMATYGGQAGGLAAAWMQARFGQPYLSGERFAYVLAKPFLRDVLVWTDGAALKAFALVVRGGRGAHYWFAFYENGNGPSSPAGHGYMADFLQWAKAEGLEHAYLGTSYGRKSRYKSRGLSGIEFWDGNGWNNDREKLASLREADDA